MMKTWPLIVLSFVLTTGVPPRVIAQNANQKEAVPKYDIAAETTIKGVVDEVKDRECPVSGTMGAHLMLKGDGKVYEVHIAPTKMVKSYDVVFQKGDEVEIKGVKTTFQGVAAILAREIKRGNDDFVFRDPQGKPIW
jgi:DNA/RNA endonuclease YhcR with UshA esterase domain